MVDEVEVIVNLLNANWIEGIGYTLFTEVDPNSELVISPSQITYTGLTEDVTYIHKATTESIDGDFSVEGSWTTSSIAAPLIMWVFAYGDTIDSVDDNTTYLGLRIQSPTNTIFLAGNGVQSSPIALSAGTQYWWTLSRSGSTVTLNIYTDGEDRAVEHASSPLTVEHSGTFDRVFALSANDSGLGGNATGIVHELENATGVQSGTTKPTFYYTGDELKRHPYQKSDSILVYEVATPEKKARGLSYLREDSEIRISIDIRTKVSRAQMILLRDEVNRIRKAVRKTPHDDFDLLLHVDERPIRNYRKFWHRVIDVRLIKAMEAIP